MTRLLRERVRAREKEKINKYKISDKIIFIPFQVVKQIEFVVKQHYYQMFVVENYLHLLLPVFQD
jgi:hypothetical protein